MYVCTQQSQFQLDHVTRSLITLNGLCIKFTATYTSTYTQLPKECNNEMSCAMF